MYKKLGIKEGSRVDHDLLSAVVHKAECSCADGASDEQIAGRELASGWGLCGSNVEHLNGVLNQSLPNIKAGHHVPRTTTTNLC